MRILPAHARDFKGRARNIPERDSFLLPYQVRWVQDQALLRVMEKSRRIGISYATAYDEVRQHAQKDCLVDTWFSSRDDLTAKEWIIYCQKFAGVLNVAAEALGTQIVDEKGNTASVQRFLNGTRINSVASNPDVFAGKGGNVGLDEFALRLNPRAVWDIANPTIDWGGRLSVISTHRGSANYFNTLVREYHEKGNPKGISLHRVTLQDALDQHFLWKLQTKLPEADPRMQMDEADYWNYQRARASSSEAFDQEYGCIPADDASAFLPFDLIDACAYAPADNLVEHKAQDGKGSIRWLLPPGVTPGSIITGLQSGELYAGFDVARKKHLSILWVFARVPGMLLTRAVIEFDRITFSRQKEIIWPVLAICRRSCIDATGLGMQIAEEAQQAFGTYRVEDITFTGPVKEELAYPVRAAFEDRSLRIPFDDAVTADLRMIRKETTAAGKIRFSADGGDSEADSHADRFWALGLARHAAANPQSGFFIPQSYDRRNNTSTWAPRRRALRLTPIGGTL